MCSFSIFSFLTVLTADPFEVAMPCAVAHPDVFLSSCWQFRFSSSVFSWSEGGAPRSSQVPATAGSGVPQEHKSQVCMRHVFQSEMFTDKNILHFSQVWRGVLVSIACIASRLY